MIRILVIDDETKFASDLAKKLIAKGYLAEAVYSGEEALDSLKRREFDILLLDLHLPGISGWDTLKRAQTLQPGIKTIILTGKPTVESAIEGIRMNTLDFLIKPIAMGPLCLAIEAAMESREE